LASRRASAASRAIWSEVISRPAFCRPSASSSSSIVPPPSMSSSTNTRWYSCTCLAPMALSSLNRCSLVCTEASSACSCWASSMLVLTTPMNSVSSTRAASTVNTMKYSAAHQPVGCGLVQPGTMVSS